MMEEKIIYQSPQAALAGYASKQVLCQSGGGAGTWEEEEFVTL